MQGRGLAATGKGWAPPGRKGRQRCPRLPRGTSQARAAGPTARLPPPASPGARRSPAAVRAGGRQAPGRRRSSLPPSRAGRWPPPVTMTVRDSGCRDGSPQSPPQQLSSMGAAILSPRRPAAWPRSPRTAAPERPRPRWVGRERRGASAPGNRRARGQRLADSVGSDSASEIVATDSRQSDHGTVWHIGIFLERLQGG